MYITAGSKFILCSLKFELAAQIILSTARIVVRHIITRTLASAAAVTITDKIPNIPRF